jgi:hypothetical protein
MTSKTIAITRINVLALISLRRERKMPQCTAIHDDIKHSAQGSNAVKIKKYG